mgnify:CR=1 FL=1
MSSISGCLEIDKLIHLHGVLMKSGKYYRLTFELVTLDKLIGSSSVQKLYQEDGQHSMKYTLIIFWCTAVPTKNSCDIRYLLGPVKTGGDSGVLCSSSECLRRLKNVSFGIMMIVPDN